MARAPWLLFAGVLFVLPLLPLPRWAGAADTGPDGWTTMLRLWGLGAVVVAGVALIASRVGPRLNIPWPGVRITPRVTVALLALALGSAAVFTALVAFGGNPQLIDEAAQLFQAKVFAAGRVAAPTPASPVFFLTQLTTVTSAGWVAQFPPGGSAMLALGVLLGAPWLINPLLAALGVWLVHRIAAGLYGPRTALAAAALWTLSAWVLFMSASYMNHVAATTFALVAWAALLGPGRPTLRHGLVAGAALAACAATRPLDAVAAALPLLVWGLRRERLRLVPWLVLGGLPVIAAWAWLNWRQWGSPLLLGYTVLYGPEHGLGFHVDPYGARYTPFVALSNLAMGVRRLHIYLYETPVPALIVPAIWATLARHRHPSDRLVLAGLVACPALYFFYWHSGFFLGPRFYYGAVPWLAIAMARGWRWLWTRARRTRPAWGINWAVGSAGAVVVAWSVLSLVPQRFGVYRDSFPTFKRHPEVALARSGVQRALVLVPESWGSRLIANLWSAGAQPGLVERVYRKADACDLANLVARAASQRVAGRALNDTLAQFTAASVQAPQVRGWADPSLRLRPRADMPPNCRIELARDQAGFTVFGNLAWLNPVGLDHGIVFARDLYERDPELLDQYAGWAVFRYAPPAQQPDALPVLTRLRDDSGGRGGAAR
jgi:hypothetical protein